MAAHTGSDFNISKNSITKLEMKEHPRRTSWGRPPVPSRDSLKKHMGSERIKKKKVVVSKSLFQRNKTALRNYTFWCKNCSVTGKSVISDNLLCLLEDSYGRRVTSRFLLQHCYNCIVFLTTRSQPIPMKVFLQYFKMSYFHCPKYEYA